MLIECSIKNCLIFIPFIFPVFFQLEYLINKKFIQYDNIIFKVFRYYLSYTLSIICLLIIKCRSKPGRNSTLNNELLNSRNRNRKNSIWINPLDIEQKKLKKGKKIRSIFFLLILSIIGIISNLFHEKYKAGIEIGKQSIGIFFEIINFIVLSMIILNVKIYSHHKFSLGIISFTLLILTISFIIYTDEDKIIKALWFYFLNAFFYCLYDVLGKKYMLLYFHSPYNTMLYIGLINSCILIIYDVISFIYFKEYNGIIKGFQENFNFSFIYIFSGIIFLEFLWNLGIWLTIYFFNPCYFIISESISETIYYIFDLLIYGNNNNFSLFNIILYSISYFINIISSLIFNEIIIINCFGLSQLKKKKIEERERLDTLIAFKRIINSKNSFSDSID